MHLATHENTPEQQQESTLLHLERELGWPNERASRIVSAAAQRELVIYKDGQLTLTPRGKTLAQIVSER